MVHEGFFVSVVMKKVKNITLHAVNEPVDRHGDIIILLCISREKNSEPLSQEPHFHWFCSIISSRTVLTLTY